MKYNFYDEKNELANEKRENLLFEVYEKYAVELDSDGKETQKKHLNASFNAEAAQAKQKSRLESRILNSGNKVEIEKLAKQKVDPSYKYFDWLQARKISYGSVVDQIEFITENGLDECQKKVATIKSKIPKK